ncbi:MAG: ABC transporter ATP-binding protein [Acidimicrobiia bacterium]|nr:ABC transporter ATP-binding protein [Acidimicrobiia bacterium]
MSPLLEVTDLMVSYGGLNAVDLVSFSVEEAGIVGLIGPNGAGKTTCIDALSGFIPHATGRVRFAGENIEGWPAHRRAEHGLVRTFQSVEMFDDLTVRENLIVAATTTRWWSVFIDACRPSYRVRNIDVEWALEATGLGGEGERYPTELGHGQRRLAGLARVLASRPRLVLLDEPAAGLDSAESVALASRLRSLPDLGIAVLLVDHDMGLVLDVCEQIHVLDLGRVIASGPPREVRTNPDVVEAYLGSEADE